LFKGSGFYITDYRSGSYQEKAKQDRAPEAGAPSGEKKPAKESHESSGGKKAGKRKRESSAE
jgi:hypothetical protein